MSAPLDLADAHLSGEHDEASMFACPVCKLQDRYSAAARCPVCGAGAQKTEAGDVVLVHFPKCKEG